MARIGIDFGTCFTSAAFIENGKPVAIDLSTGIGKGDKFSMPTCVFVDEHKVLVGQVADNKRKSDPSRFKEHFKNDLIDNIPYSIQGRYFYHPKDLAKEILLHVKKQAMKRLDVERIDHAVITYPANFSEKYRDALKEAAFNAGFVRVDLLDEPTAAAIYYASKEKIEIGTKILVYDLGGGTFDVALIEKAEEGFSLLTPSKGIANCGGKYFDDEIERHIIMETKELSDEIARLKQGGQEYDKKILQFIKDKIQEAALDVKIQLSEDVIGTAYITTNATNAPIEYKLTRAAFEKLISKDIQNSCNKIKEVVRNAGLTMAEIDRVLLVGGSTRIPYVVTMVEQTVGTKVKQDADRDLVVSFGAALWAERWAEAGNEAEQHENIEHEPLSDNPLPNFPDTITKIDDTPVPPENRNDFRCSTVEEIVRAISEAPREAVITIEPGRYELPESIVLTRPLSLQGAGSDRTFLVISSYSAILIDSDEYSGSITGVTIIHEESTRDISPDELLYSIRVLKGNVVISDCSFRGEGDVEYVGVAFEGFSTGKLMRSVFDYYAKAIQVLGSSTPVLFENRCINSWEAGIYVDHFAQPLIENNICSGHADFSPIGIWIKGEASPTLIQNLCDQNRHGIHFADQSTGSLTDNQCEHNLENGILLTDQADPILENNICTDNARAGIFIALSQPSANASVQRNICTGNHTGIVISKHATLPVEGNLCQENTNHGIEVLLSASAFLGYNDCMQNGQDGIWVGGKAAPTLQNNVCQGNRRYGISFFDEARGKALQNDCTSNQLKDVFCTDVAEPIINHIPIKPSMLAKLKYFSK
ncbi:Hsp70 family protein [Brevibacillus fluminis]|uniref:Hsp70 family protein n=1 Tax=Brevibacillus fluminis TaxID=511487 RepID=UPI003F8872A8